MCDRMWGVSYVYHFWTLAAAAALPHQILCEQLAPISQLKWEMAHIHHTYHFYYCLEIGIYITTLFITSFLFNSPFHC